MSRIESDLVIAATGTNTALQLQGKGTGKVALGDANLLWPDADGSSSGDVLQTNGSGTLSFATPAAGGAWEIIATAVVTSSTANVEFTTGIDNSYGQTAIVLSGVRSDTNNNTLRMEFGTATLSGYLGSSKYRYHIRSYNPASDTEDVERSTSGDYQFLTAAGELSYEGAYNCVLYLTDDTSFTTSTRYRPNLAGTFSMNHHSFNMNSGGIITGGARDTSDTIDRLKFTCASGNFVLGRWTIYGIKHA